MNKFWVDLMSVYFVLVYKKETIFKIIILNLGTQILRMYFCLFYHMTYDICDRQNKNTFDLKLFFASPNLPNNIH